MKKIIVIISIVLFVIAAFSIRSMTQAKAADTCKDNCALKNGHCTWYDTGGNIYVCPSKFDKKQQQE